VIWERLAALRERRALVVGVTIGLVVGLALAVELITVGGIVSLSISDGPSMGNPGAQLTLTTTHGQPEVGDVVVFEAQGERIQHRIVNEIPSGYITKGDANPRTDQSASLLEIDPVTEDQILSKVVATIPLIAVKAIFGVVVVSLLTLCVLWVDLRSFVNNISVCLDRRVSLSNQVVVLAIAVLLTATSVGAIGVSDQQPSTTNQQLFDGFEDGDLDGWSVRSGLSNRAYVVNGDAPQGDYFAASTYILERNDAPPDYTSVTWYGNVTAYSENQNFQFSGNNESIEFKISIDDGSITGDAGSIVSVKGEDTTTYSDTGINMQKNTWYKFRLSGFQPDNTAKITVAKDGAVIGSARIDGYDYSMNDIQIQGTSGNPTRVDAIQFNASLFAKSDVSGSVNNPSGDSISGVTVRAIDNGSTVTSATTDSNGDYSLSLGDGTYTLEAGGPWYTNQTKQITVSGSDKTVDFTLALTMAVALSRSKPRLSARGPGYMPTSMRCRAKIAGTCNSGGSWAIARPRRTSIKHQATSQFYTERISVRFSPPTPRSSRRRAPIATSAR